MNFIEKLKFNLEQLNQKEGIKKVLIVDGNDSRSIEAALQIKKSGLVMPILLLENNMDTQGVEKYVMNSEKQQEFANLFFEWRKGKETIEAAEKAMKTRPFYAMMMLKLNQVNAVVGGLEYTTGDMLRAAFKVIGPKKNVKTISSAMIMHKNEDMFIFSDISVNVKPNAEQLTEIGLNASEFAQSLGMDPKVAFLSFSTNKSAITEETKLSSDATDLFNKKSEIKAIGEVQFDAAFDEQIRNSKYKKESFTGKANVYVFPTLDSGNIGYKIAQRLGNYGAIGPIITGIQMPVNDLSRGALVEDVYNTILITALQTKGEN